MDGEFSFSAANTALTPATPPALSPRRTSAGTEGPSGPSTHSWPDARPEAASRPLTNPATHLDYALNLVVVEYFDSSGAIRSTIPTARELRAYREGATQG